MLVFASAFAPVIKTDLGGLHGCNLLTSHREHFMELEIANCGITDKPSNVFQCDSLGDDCNFTLC